MIKGIIFDMDGTLLDSMKYWKKSGEEVLLEMVKPRYPEFFERRIPLMQVIESLRKEIDDKEFVLEVLKTWYLKKMVNYYKKVELKEGALDFLNYCKQNNIKMCLATATPKCMALDVVKDLKLENYFTEIKTCDMGFRNKHYSDIYDFCLESMNLKKEEVLIFEDTLTPITTCKQAGYKVVGVEDLTSEPHKKQILDLVDHYITTYNDLDITKW